MNYMYILYMTFGIENKIYLVMHTFFYKKYSQLEKEINVFFINSLNVSRNINFNFPC